ncbi:hypothetical protein PV392_16380 [Streptomyces sp. ME03-5709C]|nr:hypothetical protein [Streptomyces sp. ME03-5709C]
MSEFIRIQPAPALRVPFARWAVAQSPKIRTVSPSEFAVPAHLFVDAPEDILTGALVDGRPYVPAVEEAAVPEREGNPGVPLPPVPDEAYPADAEPLPEFAPLEDAPADEHDSQPDRADADFPCDLCSRGFTTSRGRDLHRRQVHPED